MGISNEYASVSRYKYDKNADGKTNSNLTKGERSIVKSSSMPNINIGHTHNSIVLKRLYSCASEKKEIRIKELNIAMPPNLEIDFECIVCTVFLRFTKPNLFLIFSSNIKKIAIVNEIGKISVIVDNFQSYF